MKQLARHANETTGKVRKMKSRLASYATSTNETKRKSELKNESTQKKMKNRCSKERKSRRHTTCELSSKVKNARAQGTSRFWIEKARRKYQKQKSFFFAQSSF